MNVWQIFGPCKNFPLYNIEVGPLYKDYIKPQGYQYVAPNGANCSASLYFPHYVYIYLSVFISPSILFQC
jgi:hypothetical protein